MKCTEYERREQFVIVLAAIEVIYYSIVCLFYYGNESIFKQASRWVFKAAFSLAGN